MPTEVLVVIVAFWLPSMMHSATYWVHPDYKIDDDSARWVLSALGRACECVLLAYLLYQNPNQRPVLGKFGLKHVPYGLLTLLLVLATARLSVVLMEPFRHKPLFNTYYQISLLGMYKLPLLGIVTYLALQIFYEEFLSRRYILGNLLQAGWSPVSAILFWRRSVWATAYLPRYHRRS